jgi:hemerythrin superfamily protein
MFGGLVTGRKRRVVLVTCASISLEEDSGSLVGTEFAWARATKEISHMNAIDLLESQHREVEKLFAQIDKAKAADAKEKLFCEIADKLAVHAAIEEHHFYPAVKAKRTEDILLESLEEHLGIKRVLADLLDIEASDPSFDAKITVLKEQVEHHVEEEETDLFPKVKKLFSKEDLEAIAGEMSAEQAELEEQGEPRNTIPSETAHAPSL